jgi:hypothetical protein
MRGLRIDKRGYTYSTLYLVMRGLGLRMIRKGVFHIGIMRGGRVKNSAVRVSSAAEPEGCTGLVRARYREGP